MISRKTTMLWSVSKSARNPAVQQRAPPLSYRKFFETSYERSWVHTKRSRPSQSLSSHRLTFLVVPSFVPHRHASERVSSIPSETWEPTRFLRGSNVTNTYLTARIHKRKEEKRPYILVSPVDRSLPETPFEARLFNNHPFAVPRLLNQPRLLIDV